jgi:DNA repair protein SbcC/Rad50
MILKTLVLRNYRKFKQIVVEFPDGVTGVIGLNGAGKSTIFEAISWVLYGPVAARTSADQIKREGAETSEPCRVELEFVFEDDQYRIVREMTGKNLAASATATVNGNIAASGAETVSKFVQKKLGMDFKSFFTSIFAKQKELNALSTMNASERRPLILKMLGIDALDEVIKEIRSDKRHKSSLIEKLSQDLVDKTGKDKVEKYNAETRELNEKQKVMVLSIKQVKEKIQTFKKELETLEKKYKNSKNEYEKINLRKEQLGEQKTLFENKGKLQEQIKELQNKIEKRQASLEEQQKELKGFGDIAKEIKNVEERMDKTDKEIEEIIKIKERKKTLITSLNKSIREIDSKRKNIEKMGPDASCPTCDRVLGDQHDQLLKKFDEEKNSKNKEIEIFSKDILIKQEKYEKTFRERQALEKKRDYIQKQHRKKERIDTTIRNTSIELEREKKEIEDKEKQKAKIGEVEFDLKEYGTVKNQVKGFYSKYQSMLDLLGEKKDQLGSAKLELEKKEGEKKLIISKIKTLHEKMDELKEFKKRITNEKRNVQNLKMLSDVMSSFRSHLISRIRPALSLYASDFFSRLTDGKYQEIDIDENYNLMVYDGGNPYAIERFSGGEEDLANLCLRLAISEVITERAGGLFNFIILDEIFGSQDMIRRQNIMKALNSLSSKFKQIFLITHIEDIKNYMENIILVSENESGISTVKIE